eukprot:snap_masked-scaffold_24-processed-gene-1.4-mRNA-1 protein AED:1.00 eAED:1.00 QI:0/-1/0/0/-1/1/1/0/570
MKEFLPTFLLGVAFANKDVMETIIKNQDNAHDFYFDNPAARPASFKQTQDDPTPIPCENGYAVVDGESFPCNNVDFYSFVAYAEMEITNRAHTVRMSMADIWGAQLEDGREITIAGMDNGFATVDTTDPFNPCVLAKYPSTLRDDRWDDVKVVNNLIVHVKDSSQADDDRTQFFGIEMYDLLKLNDLDCHEEGYTVRQFFPDFITSEHGRSHNIVTNEKTNRMYSVGSQICSGGLVAYDVSGEYRLNPRYLGCADADGYSHDAACVVYTGPDTRFTGREICFGFNEDTLTVWDVTDMEIDVPAVMLSRTPYNNSAYAHQGWVNRDMTKVLLDDELDELCNEDFEVSRRCNLTGFNLDGTLTTTTNVFDITDLTAPFKEFAYQHNDPSIDHNLYVWGAMYEQGFLQDNPREYFPNPYVAYMNNYQAGLKVVDIRSDDPSDWSELGYFDVTPDSTALVFLGSWSGFMHPSGVYALNSIERGLFLLKPNMAFDAEFPAPPASSDDDEEGEDSDESEGGSYVSVDVIILGIAILLLSMVILILSGNLVKQGISQQKVQVSEVTAKELTAGKPLL